MSSAFELARMSQAGSTQFGRGGSPHSSHSRTASSLDVTQNDADLNPTPQQTPAHIPGVLGSSGLEAETTAAIYRHLMAAAAAGGSREALERGLSFPFPSPGVPGGGGGVGADEDEGSPNQPGSYAFTRQMELSRAKLKATSRTSALLSGFAMVALVELDYGHVTESATKALLIPFGVITTSLVSVHLLALMMSTCILPHLETSSPRDSPHVRLKWYIEVSWFFSTCLGLLLFLLEIAVIFWIKFIEAGYPLAAYVTTIILVPVFILFLVFTYTFYRKLMIHKVEHMTNQLDELKTMFRDLERGDSASASAPNAMLLTKPGARRHSPI